MSRLTEKRGLDVVAIADLQVVHLAVVGLGDVQLRDVQDDLLAMGSRNSPLTQLFFADAGLLGKFATGVLQSSATLCNDHHHQSFIIIIIDI